MGPLRVLPLLTLGVVAVWPQEQGPRLRVSAAVIDSVDPRGIPETRLQAQDDTGGMEQEDVRAAIKLR